ncbi:MAG: hypothetical protein WAX04_11650 [Oscillospiraceae bacterium]
MDLIKSERQWALNAFIIYSLLSLVGLVVDYLGRIILADSDGTEIISNILTSTQGFFTGVLGYGDFFEYSGFYLIPFVLGGIVWILVAIFLCYVTRNKNNTKEKLRQSGKILISFGTILGIISTLIIGLYIQIAGDIWAILILFFLATIIIPPFIVGLVLFGISKSLTLGDKQ